MNENANRPHKSTGKKVPVGSDDNMCLIFPYVINLKHLTFLVSFRITYRDTAYISQNGYNINDT